MTDHDHDVYSRLSCFLTVCRRSLHVPRQSSCVLPIWKLHVYFEFLSPQVFPSFFTGFTLKPVKSVWPTAFPTVQMLLIAHPWHGSLCSSALLISCEMALDPRDPVRSMVGPFGQTIKDICFFARKHVVRLAKKSVRVFQNPKQTFWPTQCLVVLPLEMLAAILTLSAKVHWCIGTLQNIIVFYFCHFFVSY